MMEFMVEMVITAFAFGGIIGAVVALHLSSNLKGTEATQNSTPATIELARGEKAADLKPAPVDITSKRNSEKNRHHR